MIALVAISYIIFAPSGFLYEPIGWLDTFVYIGYGLNYPSHEFYYGYYKISRLVWIYILSFFWNLFRPEIVTPILASLFIVGQGILSYSVAYRFTRNLSSSTLIGLLVTLSPLFHNIGGWNYHNHPLAIFFLLALLLMPIERNRARISRYIITFSIISLCFFINPLFFTIIPAFIILCCAIENGEKTISMQLLLDKQSYIRRHIKFIFKYFILTFICITLLLCVSFYFTYGEFLFFKQNLHVIFESIFSNFQKPWVEPLSLKFLTHKYFYISFHIYIFSISIFLLLYYKFNNSFVKNKRINSLILVGYSLTFIIYIISIYMKIGVYNYNYHVFNFTIFAILPLSIFTSQYLNKYHSSIIFPSLLIFISIIFISPFAAKLKLLFAQCLPEYPLFLLIPILFLKFILIVVRRYFSNVFNFIKIVPFVAIVLFFITISYNLPIRSPDTGPLNRIMLRHYEKILLLDAEQLRTGRKPEQLNAVFRTAVIDKDIVGNTYIDRFAASFSELGLTSISYDASNQKLDTENIQKFLSISKTTNLIIFGSSLDIQKRAEKYFLDAGLKYNIVMYNYEVDNDLTVFMWVYKFL
jgi:hypothetical protein